MAGEYPHIEAVLQGPIPDLIIAAWSELAAEHVATGFYSSYTSFSRMFPYRGNPLACAVANTAPYARYLEEGHGGFHLPTSIDWGKATGKGTAKANKEGRRYLRIPFRHMTPGTPAGGISSARKRMMMPSGVYRDALTALRGDRRSREARRAVGRLAMAGTRLSRPYGLGTFPEALRLRAVQQEGMPGYTWRSRTYEGLMRREQVSPASGAKSSTYMTIRTLTEDSVGWYIPPAAGFHFAEHVVEQVRPMIEDLVAEAARDDVVELLRVRVGEQSVHGFRGWYR